MKTPICVAERFKYENLHIGGGGYVTGMVIHPKNSDIMYIRTDVGGAYKWIADKKEWHPITEFFSWKERLKYNIDGIALDPNDENILYLCCGDGGEKGTSSVYKSCDRGESFIEKKVDATFLGNANYRQDGEPIMVDPNNSSVVYCGTRREGLMVSLDGAESFSFVEGIPSKTESVAGVRGVIIDPRETVDGRSKRIYVSLPGDNEEHGIYISDDGAKTFKKIEGFPPRIRRMALSPDGVLFVTTLDGVYKYENGKVTDISPKVEKRSYRAVAVSPDGEKVIVGHANTGPGDCMNMKIFYSADKGKTWAERTENKIKENKTNWWPEYFFSSATATLTFNPDNDKEVWFTDWYGVWMTKDITAETVVWRLEDAGHEEAVVTDIMSNKEGNLELVTALVDNGGMYYSDVSLFPDGRHSDNATSLDFCETAPDHVVISENNNAGTIGKVKVSEDYGKSYKKTAYEGTAIRVAINPEDYNNFMVVPINDTPRYTFDGGETWNSSVGAPNDIIRTFWGAPRPICSDRFKAGVFYLLSRGAVYKSTDGGKNFRKTTDLSESGEGTIKANPYKKGEIYVCLGKNGFFVSKDFGETFSKTEGVVDAMSVSFGPSKNGDGYMLYLLGEVNNKIGLFMTENGTEEMLQLNDEKTNKLGKAEFITADRRVFGRVFIGTDGRGIVKSTNII